MDRFLGVLLEVCLALHMLTHAMSPPFLRPESCCSAGGAVIRHGHGRKSRCVICCSKTYVPAIWKHTQAC